MIGSAGSSGILDAWSLEDAVISDRVADFDNGALTRRWAFSSKVDQPLGYESYTSSITPGSGSAFELLADHLGSVSSVIANASGTVVTEYAYDSFGHRQTTGASDQPYGFTGREHDDESGLIYLRARQYDPATGVFLQHDPIGFEGGDLNLYAYVRNNPINLTDPTGLFVDTKMQNDLESQIRAAALPQVIGGTMMVAARITALLTVLTTGEPEEEPEAAPQPQPAASGSGNGHGHHCWPQAYGGAKGTENILHISAAKHIELHRLMRKFFQGMVSVYGQSWDYKKGYSGKNVVLDFGLSEVKKRVVEFYEAHRDDEWDEYIDIVNGLE